jgi:RNA polymerase sigma-70 factor (ECF subfamily)
MDELSGDQRACLVLRFHVDQSVPQIAAALDLREGTVKSHIHRGLAKLRRLIGDDR